MSQAGRGAAAGSGAFLSMGRSVAFASGTFLGAAGLVAGLKTSSEAASNLNEQTNKVRAVFKDSSAEVEAFGKTTADSLGIANDQALEAAGTFGNLFTTVHLAPAENARLSTSLVKLAADLASFNNADPSEALDALRSGLIGEAEPLRRFGVLLSETRVQQEAMRETGKNSAKQLTDQEKILARYALILKDTAPAQGDFAKTSEQLANNQRILHARLRDSAAAMGTELNPAIQDLTTFSIAALDAVSKLAAGINKLPGGNFSGVDLFTGIAHGLGRFGHRVFDPGFLTSPPSTAVTGEDIGQRGAAARQATVAGLGGTPLRPRASLAFQMSMLRSRFAQAELTATQRDDRATLVLMQNLLHRQITATKDLKLRTQLYGDLGNVQDQITAIDDKAAADKQDALDKEKAAKEKELAAEKKRLEAHRDHIRQMRAAWAATLEKIRQATDAVQSEFGALPFQPTPAGILGVQGQSTKSFVGAYVNQTRQFVGFYNDLNRLSKRGAPGGLVEQIRGQGVGADSLVRGLLTHPRQLRTLIRAFGERKEAAMQIAHADIHARMVHIHMGGARPGATPAATRRGRNAGIPLTKDYLIGGG